MFSSTPPALRARLPQTLKPSLDPSRRSASLVTLPPAARRSWAAQCTWPSLCGRCVCGGGGGAHSTLHHTTTSAGLCSAHGLSAGERGSCHQLLGLRVSSHSWTPHIPSLFNIHTSMSCLAFLSPQCPVGRRHPDRRPWIPHSSSHSDFHTSLNTVCALLPPPCRAGRRHLDRRLRRRRQPPLPVAAPQHGSEARGHRLVPRQHRECALHRNPCPIPPPPLARLFGPRG